MTTEIERKFLDAFGIEPRKVEISCNECASRMEECGCFDCEKEIHHIPDKENDIYKKVRAVFGLESEGE